MSLTRRDLLKASAAIIAAPGLSRTALATLQQVVKGEANAPVVWLVGQACSGCSVSLLNSICYTTPDDLLMNVVDMEFHPTIMAASLLCWHATWCEEEERGRGERERNEKREMILPASSHRSSVFHFPPFPSSLLTRPLHPAGLGLEEPLVAQTPSPRAVPPFSERRVLVSTAAIAARLAERAS